RTDLMKRPANRQHRHSGARRPPLPRTGPRSRKAPGPMPRNIYRRAETAAGSEMICGIKARCGVCQYVNLDYAASLKEKHQAGLSLLEKAGVMGGARVLPPTVAPKPLEYRSLFKLAVRPAKPNPADRLGEGEPPRRFSIGLFAQGSHDVVEVDQCPLHVPALKRFLEDLRVELDLSPITPY